MIRFLLGISLAVLLHRNGHHVTVWARNPEEILMLSKEREHKSKLPGVKLPEDMVFTNNLEEGMQDKCKGLLHPGLGAGPSEDTGSKVPALCR